MRVKGLGLGRHRRTWTAYVIITFVVVIAGLSHGSNSNSESDEEEETLDMDILHAETATTIAATFGAVNDAPSQSEPYFDKSTPINVTAQQEKVAYLHCQVRQLGNKTVSWVRHRDLHILTVGRYTYISDQRFQAYHLANSDDWTLQIRYTQSRDAGIYECQVSTVPKKSLLINLNVVVPKAKIEGGDDLHVKTGSTITIRCVITECPEPPVYIFWYHEDKVLNYETPRLKIETEPIVGDTTVSRLLITNAQPTDSGNYTCSPSNTDKASVIVHVLNGETPAAMQHGKHSSGTLLRCQTLAVVLQISIGIWITMIKSVI